MTDERVEFFSDDTFGEIAIPLTRDLEFGAGDFSRESPDDAATYGRFLAIFAPVKGDPENPESINIIEVNEEE